MGRDKAFVEVGGREMLDRLLEVGRSACSECVLVVGDAAPYREALARWGWAEVGPPPGAAEEATPGPPPARAGKDGDAARSAGPPRFERGGAGLRLVTDRHPGLGPVAGLEAGLGAAERPLCFVSACDLPFLTAAVVAAILGELEAHRAETPDPELCAVVPVAGGRRQPLAAAYARGAARAAERCVEERALRMDDMLGRLDVRAVAAEDLPGGGPAGGGGPFANVNSPEELRDARRRARSGGAP